MVVDGAVVMVENIVRHLSAQDHDNRSRGRQDSCRRARGAAAGFLRHRHHHHRLSADLHSAAGGRQAVSSDGLDGGVRAARRGHLLDDDRAGAGEFLFRKEARDWQNPVLVWLTKRYRGALSWTVDHRWAMITVALVAIGISGFLVMTDTIGSEFLPHLDEGALWVRGTLAPSTGPTEGIRVSNQARIMLCSFPEATECTSQTGRPDDGTDTTGFFNTEYFVGAEAEGTVASGIP